MSEMRTAIYPSDSESDRSHWCLQNVMLRTLGYKRGGQKGWHKVAWACHLWRWVGTRHLGSTILTNLVRLVTNVVTYSSARSEVSLSLASLTRRLEMKSLAISVIPSNSGSSKSYSARETLLDHSRSSYKCNNAVLPNMSENTGMN